MTRVLVASDGSEFAVRSAKRGLGILASPVDVTVITVVPVLSGPGGPAGVPPVTIGATAMAGVIDPEAIHAAEDASIEDAQTKLEAVIRQLGTRAEARLERGDPGSRICEVAAGDAFDVIVIGSHGEGLLKRVLMGSVSNHVLHHAPCPVLVIREDSFPERAVAG